MKSYLSWQYSVIMNCLLSALVAACSPNQGVTIPTSTPIPISTIEPTAMPTLTPGASQESATASGTPSTNNSVVVAFVKDGNIQVWDELSGQSQTIVTSGDVRAVSMSDDGQVIAFLRRARQQLSESEWFEYSALWAVDRDGANPRELVSAESLRQRLNAGERDSTNIPDMEWIPGTHHLLYSGWKYIVQAEGESHAIPEGLYLVDADTLAETVLIPASNYLHFSVSPDGQQIALMSLTGLSFINMDGSNQRQDVLTYPQVGMGAPLFPTAVWTQDSRAFLITGSFESSNSGINFTVWRVPVDGSPPDALATILRSGPDSTTFSPDGKRVAFVQFTDGQPAENAGWSITPLAAEVGPLLIPNKIEFERYANVHWSPAGDTFTKNLLKLCPDATRDTAVCDSPFSFRGTMATIQWIDGNRVLFLTRDPAVLFLCKLVFDGNYGTTVPIAAWRVEEFVSQDSFTATEGPMR